MKNLSAFIIISFFILNIASVSAQNETGTISGVVLDRSTGQPLESAVISVFKDSTKIKGAETDAQGKYTVQVPYGTYRVEINYIGYSVATISKVTISAGKPDIALNTVQLKQGSAMTEEIEVETERSSMELLPDKKVFNVGDDIVNNGGNATDVLKVVPSVSVDIDGNVSLRGSGNVKILVDGKPSGLDGQSEADILQQIPANMIQRIELITNPSAKYEAESSSGIINIVLKKDTKIFGYSGNFSLGAGTKDKYNGSANLTMKTNKLNIYGNYNYRLFNFGMNGNSQRQDLYDNTFLNQNSNTNMRMLGQFLKAGVDYNFDEKNTISLSSTYNTRERTRNGIDTNFALNSSGILTDYSVNKNNSTNKGYGIDVSLNYNGFFSSPQNTLTGEISYSRSKNDNTGNTDLRTYDPNGNLFNINPDLDNTTSNTIQNYTNIQFDYVIPFGNNNQQKSKWNGMGNRKNGKGFRGNNENNSDSTGQKNFNWRNKGNNSDSAGQKNFNRHNRGNNSDSTGNNSKGFKDNNGNNKNDKGNKDNNGNNGFGNKGNWGNRDNGKDDAGESPRKSMSMTKLETGLRSIFRSTDNDYIDNSFDSTQQQYVYNPFVSNHFKYTEQIHSGYGIFTSNIKDFGYSVGLRAEATITEGNLITNGTIFKKNYIDFFPNVSLSQKIGTGDEIQASYSRKINRPRLNDLNPFVDISDPLNISVGNPELKPEYANSFELNYLKFFNTTTLEASAFYKQTNDEIVRSRSLTDSGVTVTTMENLASSKSYGLELIAISQVTPWLSINGSASYFKSVLKGNLSIGGIDNSNYSWNAKASANIKLWADIGMQLLYNYQGEFVTPQGQVKPVQTFDAAVKKDFLDGRATVSFRVSDVFNTQKFNSFTEGTGFLLNSERKRDSRTAFLTLTFKLGNIDYKRKPDRKKKTDNNDNNDNSDDPGY